MKWFGHSWGAPVCDADSHTVTPVGAMCTGWCLEDVEANDQGFILPAWSGSEPSIVYHKNCFLRTVLGSVAHQQGSCSCHGGTDNDPPGMSKRQAADAAVEAFHVKEYVEVMYGRGYQDGVKQEKHNREESK